jgi:urease accessory protein
MHMEATSHVLLALLHLADSALAVGSTAHSFGLETLVEDGCLCPHNVEALLRDYLSENGVLEASFVRRARQGENTLLLSDEFASRRIARESRDAGLKMGRRLAQLVNALLRDAVIPEDLYYPVAFGLAAARLDIPEADTVVAYLRQSIAGLVSACQRLMPLGQVEASCVVWNLRESIERAALQLEIGRSEVREVSCFTPLLELASMRHGSLETRLFIS